MRAAKRIKILITVLAGVPFGAAFFSSTFAQESQSPAAGSAYLTDSQGTYAEDLVNDALETANDILCYFGNSRIDDLATEEETSYVALIDPNRCSGDGVVQAERQASNSTNKRLDRILVSGTKESGLDATGHVYLADDDSDRWDPVWAKIDVGGDNELTSHIYVDENSGEFTLRYSLYSVGGVIAFDYRRDDEGTIEVGKGYSEPGNDIDTGQGYVQIDDNEYAFGYNQEYYCRVRNGEEELCFYRDADKGQSSAWEYGLYNPDGSRFTQNQSALSGMSIRLEGREQGGWVDYAGVWFPREQLLNLKNEQSVIGDDGEQYTLNYIRYRLDEYIDKAPLEPGDINKSPFWVFDSEADWEFFWDQDNQRFQTQGYDPTRSLEFKDPENFEDVKSSYTELQFLKEIVGVSDPEADKTYTFSAWDFLRNINLTFEFDGAGEFTAVLRDNREQLNTADIQENTSLEEGTELYCFERCPTMADVSEYKTDVDENGRDALDPWSALTGNKTYTVTYTPVFGLLDENDELMEWPRGIDDNVPGAYGFRIDLHTIDDSSSAPSFALEVGNGYDSYLMYQDGDPVVFSEPLFIEYDVPADVENYGGATMYLQVSGSEIDIPGGCYDRITGEEEYCDEDSEWRHDFLIPYDPEVGVVRLDDDSEDTPDQLLVKWLSREVAFGPAPAGVSAASQNITLGTVGRMEEVLENLSPCNARDANANCYAGEFPADDVIFSDPKVIHGEIVDN